MSDIGKDKQSIKQLKNDYRVQKKAIISRLGEFKKCLSEYDDADIFTELAFCILTPQSKAKSCWDAVKRLKEQGLLLHGKEGQIKKSLSCVRFHNKKAKYLITARSLFLIKGRFAIKSMLHTFSDSHACRDWLVKNIKGIGLKEASHFLRNIGLGDTIAILDRHVLRHLHKHKIIEGIPKSMSRNQYLQIEKIMIDFSEKIGIPLSHLDLLFWYRETGEIFK